MSRRRSTAGNRRLRAADAKPTLLGRVRAAVSKKATEERPKRRSRPPVKPAKPRVAPSAPDTDQPRAKASRGGGFIWVWALAVALASVAFVFHLDVRFDIIRTGYALAQAQGEQRALRLSQRELRLELATLKAPGRIEEQAREELGMERPNHERIIRLGQRRGRRLALRRR